jgi:hypothetical protein
MRSAVFGCPTKNQKMASTSEIQQIKREDQPINRQKESKEQTHRFKIQYRSRESKCSLAPANKSELKVIWLLCCCPSSSIYYPPKNKVNAHLCCNLGRNIGTCGLKVKSWGLLFPYVSARLTLCKGF